MSTTLISIFGSEIKVGFQPRSSQIQYTAFPGAHGLTGIRMGSRGYPIFVTGKLVGSGGSYAAARANLTTTIDAIENHLWADMDTYTFGGNTFDNVVFEKFQLVPRNGKYFFLISTGDVVCYFVAILRSMA